MFHSNIIIVHSKFHRNHLILFEKPSQIASFLDLKVPLSPRSSSKASSLSGTGSASFYPLSFYHLRDSNPHLSHCRFHIKWPLFSAKVLQNAPVFGEKVTNKRPINVKYPAPAPSPVVMDQLPTKLASGISTPSPGFHGSIRVPSLRKTE